MKSLGSLHVLISLILAFLLGCSTKKNSFINRTYHNTTAHYNVLFNGNEAQKEVVSEIEKNHKDDYDHVLPMFRLGTSEQSKSIYPQADKAIAKASKCIQKHSMLINGKERVKWIKDAYLLIGQANFYKYDYMPALEMFQYVFKQYDKTTIKYDALFWLARTYNERGSTNEAQSILDLYESELDKVKKKKRWQFYTAYADNYIKQEKFGLAIPMVLKSIEFTKNKKSQNRYKFILAQLCERTGDKTTATNYYSEVLRRNSAFEMEFNARINRALVFESEKGNGEELKNELKKLARDDKYIEFQDKIFYALGSIEEEDDHKTEAIEYYRKSVKASTTNQNQKGKSYLKLADIFFKESKYEIAAVYFDSTVAFLSPKDEKYSYATVKKDLLDELMENIHTIRRQDSLLKIANMGPNEMEAYIDEIIEQKKAEDIAKKELEELQQKQQASTLTNTGGSGGSPSPPGGALWYFYNPTAMSFGLADFNKKFGNRKLEDNWRRSNKQSNPLAEIPENGPGTPDSIKPEYTQAFYLKDIPLKPEQKLKATQKIMDAYFNLGIIYREQLNENLLAVTAFEQLLNKYPETKYKLTTYYQLYKAYADAGNADRSNFYKNKILSEFPTSDYAKIILDPSIATSLKTDKQKMEAMYDATYNAFLNLNYDSVITVANQVDERYNGDPIQPKFAYLRALAIGRSATVPEFEASLRSVVIHYPKNKVKEEALAILDFIEKLTSEEEDFNKKNFEIPTTPTSALPKDTLVKEIKSESSLPNPSLSSQFTFAPDSGHYCMFVLLNKTNEANKLKSSLSDFNSKYFSLEEIAISSVQIGSKTSVFISKFPTMEKAKNYFSTVTLKGSEIASHQPGDYKLFLISENNFGKLIKTGDVDAYFSFFQEKYKP